MENNNNNTKGLKKSIEESVRLDRKELQKKIQKIKKIYNWEEEENVLLKVYKGLCEN